MARTRRRRGRPKDEGLTARRREEIIAAAVKVFAERGYPGTDLQEVADAIEVGKGTIYRYFPSKRALFLAAVDQGMVALRDHVVATAAEAQDPLDILARSARGYLEFFDRNPQLIELFVQERAEFRDRKKPTYLVYREASLEPWIQLLKGLADAGRVRPVDPEGFFDLVSDMLFGILFTRPFGAGGGRGLSLASHVDALVDMILFGVLSDEERARRRAGGAGGGR